MEGNIHRFQGLGPKSLGAIIQPTTNTQSALDLIIHV